MWLDESAPIRKRDLVLEKPLVNAPGTLGFVPDLHRLPALSQFGAFVTAPISYRARKPAANRCCLPFPGGFLLHSGLQNPGIHQAIARFGRRWAAAPLPVMVTLLVETPETLARMLQSLERLENLMGVILGLPPETSAEFLEEIMTAAAGELPVVPSLSPEQIPVLLAPLRSLEPAAVHLSAPRGTLPGPEGGWVSGRVYGPATYPLMLQAARTLVEAGLRVVAQGGIYSRAQMRAFLDLGTAAVAVGPALWQVDLGDLFVGESG
jgi:dihydroorotate dehydrogenase